jgi:N-acetylglucosamine-6-phosphate deacetylase
MPPGRYSIVGMEIELLPSGQVAKVGGRCMPGSSVAMNRAITVFMQFAQVTLQDALQAATENPARLLQRGESCANISKGEPANLVLFGSDEQALQIETVISRGQTVYCRDDRSTTGSNN